MKKEGIEKWLRIVGIVFFIILVLCATALIFSGERVYGYLIFCYIFLFLVVDYLYEIKNAVDRVEGMALVLLMEKYEGDEIEVERKGHTVTIKKKKIIKSE